MTLSENLLTRFTETLDKNKVLKTLGKKFSSSDMKPTELSMWNTKMDKNNTVVMKYDKANPTDKDLNRVSKILNKNMSVLGYSKADVYNKDDTLYALVHYGKPAKLE